LRFNDVLLAAAALVLVGLILDAFLMVGFSPMSNSTMSDLLAFVIGFLVTALIVGYVFALKIQEESRSRAVSGIVLVSATALLFFTAIWIATPLAAPWFKQSMTTMFNTSGWTNYDWAAYSALTASIDVVVASVVSLVGLYIGSILRKPKKT